MWMSSHSDLISWPSAWYLIFPFYWVLQIPMVATNAANCFCQFRNCFSNYMAVGTEEYCSLEPFLRFLKVTADTPVYSICVQNIHVLDWMSETCTWLRLGHKLHKYELLVHSKTEFVDVIKYLLLYLLSETLPLHQVNIRCPKNALGRAKLVQRAKYVTVNLFRQKKPSFCWGRVYDREEGLEWLILFSGSE